MYVRTNAPDGDGKLLPSPSLASGNNKNSSRELTDQGSQQPSSPQSPHTRASGLPPSSRSPRSPRTPHRTQHVHSPVSSPTLPSPMSLYQLGIGSPLSPLRRQLTSPLARSPPSPKQSRDGMFDGDEEGGGISEESSEQDDLTQDSKDVLVERLTDLVQRLSQDGQLEGQDINNLHAKVDEMEHVLAGNERAASGARHRRLRRGSLLVETKGDGRDAFHGAPTTPTWLVSRFSDMSQSAVLEAQRPESPVATVSSEVADRLVAEAEKLCAELSAVVTSLQARREESDHIHELLIERAELAARRIIELEGKLEELSDEVQENESELSHLRLQLRAVEARCLEYVPQDADQELLESIENWKSDWAGLKRKMAERHLSHASHSFTEDVTVTSVGTAGH